MPKITYYDEDGSAPRVTWHGVTFLHGVPVDVDDDILAQKARGNRFFEVDGEGDAPAPAKRKGGWPAGKPRKAKETPPELIEEAPAGEDDDEEDEDA